MAVTSYTTIDGVVLAEKRAASDHDYLPDPLGSTAALLDNAQAKSDTYAYWPYGEIRANTGVTMTPFRFVGSLGYYRDTPTQTYVRARVYNQKYARWTSGDLLWPREKLYEYSRDNPVTLSDVTGLQAPSPAPVKYLPFIQEIIGYGNYCGGDRNPITMLPSCILTGPGLPPFPTVVPVFPPAWDDLDSCCAPHDYAYKVFHCKPVVDLRPECILADAALCACAQRVKCSRQYAKGTKGYKLCEEFKTNVEVVFCFGVWAGKGLRKYWEDLTN